MIYSELCGEKVSLLGFGAMRLPCKDDKSVDEAQVQKMTDIAIESGVNYFDTAYPYHNGMSEIVIGKCLKKYPRESFKLATKYPGHQIASSYNPAETFEEQLKKCDVDYFDFYLLHNVYENSIKNYTNPELGMVAYFGEEKKKGRIKHLGFSCHGDVPCLKEYLDFCDKIGVKMEFCQIQLNFLDWTLQHAKEKYELLTSRNIPIVVMEPLRGGNLAKSEDFTVSEAFRYFQSLPNVKVVLSGMSNLEQMEQNLATFKEPNPLSEADLNRLYESAEKLKNAVPCTACRYCVSSCPQKLDIPFLISMYNDLCFDGSFIVGMKVEAIPERKQPSACMGCKSCEKMCPQKIGIADVMKDFTERFSKMPHWAEMCRQREEAARKLREGK